MIFNNTVKNPPMLNPSATISDDTYSWNDMTGSSSSANFVGSVSSYTNGEVSAISLLSPPASGMVVSVEYTYATTGIAQVLESCPEAWLEFVINGNSLLPRQRLVAVPYALDVPRASSVKGDIVVGHNTSPMPEAGTIRWTGINFEGFNGAKWTLLNSSCTADLTVIGNRLDPESNRRHDAIELLCKR